MTPYEIVIIKDELNIIYHGFLSKNNPDKIYIVCGFGINWENTQKIEMHKIEEYFIAKVKILNNNAFNFCFCNEKDEWDNNYSKDYSYITENIVLNNLDTNENIEKQNKIEMKEEQIESQNLFETVETKNESIEMNSINDYKYNEDTIIEPENKISFEIQDNGVLLISEIQNKVVLPYTKNEVLDIYNNSIDKYKSIEEVIEKNFTRDLNDFRHQFSSRFRETINLVVKKEKMSYFEGLNLASELWGKRYLHPAIISACKNLEELNVYLDCLDKNELEDFKIFKIKYELYPMITKNSFNIIEKTNILHKISKFIKNLFRKRENKAEIK